MSQEMTPAQLERLKQQRAQRFKEMGLPSTAGQIAEAVVEHIPSQRVYDNTVAAQPIQQEIVQEQYIRQEAHTEIPNESNVAAQIQQQLFEERNQRQNAMYTAPRDKFNALEAIRNGAKKQEYKTFIKAESPNQQFEEMKVVKKRRPGQPQEKSNHAVEPKVFNVRKSAEADMFESMFTDKSSGINMRSTSSGVPSGNLIEANEDYSNIGPSFDPVAHMRKKAAEKGVNIDFQNKNVLNEQKTQQVFQADNSSQMGQLMMMMETMMKNNQKSNGYDLSELKTMMESTAKKVAEETMKKVLKEYVESKKTKSNNTYEVVNKDQNVVKIGEKFYKLTPVVPKS